MQDELSLLARARSLEPAALAQIHDRYYPPLFRYIVYRVSDPTAAEDLTSEVFTRLLAALRDGRAPRSALQGWLFSVAAHIVNDHFRRRYRHPSAPLDDQLPSSDASPLEIAEDNVTRAALRDALAALTDEQQTVIALRFGSDLPIREVAEIMGKSEGAVKQLQARAIAALNRSMTAGAEQ